ncbi:MAG: hypothetical protein ABI724_00980 [Betaproteobacteria bacterium]
MASGLANAATTLDATPANYRDLIPLLHAGDTLRLAAGEYRDGLALHDLAGAADRAITISGPAAGTPATFIARPLHNTVSIVDSHHVVLKNLVLDGHDLPVDAVKSERPSRYAHHITLENLLIIRHGNNQQTVGISTKCPAWNWVVRGNTIVGAGTGMYFGDSDGSAPFVAGVIERNLIVDTIGYNLQIKHQLARPDIAGMPREASVTTIRYNVFANAGGGSPAAPRPNVLVGHFPTEGPGVEDRYAVYGNFFYRNRYEALFQGEGNVALYSNIFVNPHGDAIRIQPHNDIPRRIDIAFNTVLAERIGIAVVVNERSASYRQAVVANAVFAAVPIAGGTQSGNFTGTLADAERRLTRPFAILGEFDPYPRARWENAADSDPPNPAALPDWDRDFNRRPRQPGSIGAYGDSGANPGRLPTLSLMPE